MIRGDEVEQKKAPTKSEARRKEALKATQTGGRPEETPKKGRKFFVPGHGLVEAETLAEAISKINK